MATPFSEFHTLNARFLVLLQQAAKTSPSDAARAFRVSEALCARIATLSLDELENFAKTNALVFSCRFDESALEFASASASPALRAVMLEARTPRA